MNRFLFLMLAFLTFAVLGHAQDTSVTNSVTATNAVEGAEEAAQVLESEPSTVEKSSLDSWITYIRQGGRTMIFIGLLSVLGLGCFLERVVNLRRSRIVPDGFSAEVIRLWKDDDFDAIRKLCLEHRSVLGNVVETMLEYRGSKDYQAVKMFAEDKAGRELRLENRKAAMLATVATIAPLLGLFGTVVGLLGAFGTVAAVGEMGDPSILADDIGKALITTVAGLAVSMPALFVYQLIKNKLNLYAVILEEEVNDLVNRLFVQIAN